MKNSKTLKNVIEVLTAFIYFCGFMTVAALVVHLLSRIGLFKDLIQSGRLSFDANGIQLFPKHPQPLSIFTFSSPFAASSKISTKKRSFLTPTLIFATELGRFSWSCPLCLAHLKPVEMLISSPSLSNLPLTQGFSLPFQSSGSLARF